MIQLDFLGDAPVAGLRLIEDVVTPDTEALLAARIDDAPLAPFKFQRWEGKRLTASYGSGYDYERGAMTAAPPIPGWLRDLAAEIAPRLGVDPGAIAQALVIRYDSGAGIGWHRDRPQYGQVIGLSLSAPARLRLRRRTDTGFERAGVWLPPRSAYLLDGPARREWEHSIAPQEATRRSITLRTLAG